MSLHTLDDWIAELSGRHSVEINLGLSRVAAVAASLKIDVSSSQVVTVAGTNGKGSCVATIEALALAADKTVCTLTSPHFYSFNERIRVNGVNVNDTEIVDAFKLVDSVAEHFKPTFFEMNVLAALVIFAKQSADIIILEVGLGGRLDAVNVIDPDCAVITSIGLDHTDWLGDTIEKIGAEKAGILRQGIPAVLAAIDMPSTVKERASSLGCTVYQLGTHFDHEQGQNWRLGNVRFTTNKAVQLPPPSVAAALQVANCLNWFDNQDRLINVFQQVAPKLSLTGRFESRLLADKQWFFDVAHNQPAAQFLYDRLGQSNAAIDTIVFAVMADKDVDSLIKPLLGLQAKWALLRLSDNDRAMFPEQLRSRLIALGVSPDDVDIYEVNKLKALIASGQLGSGLVCGSFFTVSAINLTE